MLNRLFYWKKGMQIWRLPGNGRIVKNRKEVSEILQWENPCVVFWKPGTT